MSALITRPVLFAASLALAAVLGSVEIAAGSGAIDVAESSAVSEFTFGDDVPEALQVEIRQAVDATESWLRTEAGLELPALHVVAGGDRQMLLSRYSRGGPVPDRDRPLLDLWFKSGGAITSGLDVFIFTNERWNGLGRAERTFVIAHEVFHTLQYGYAARSGDAIPGPIWLVEGAAEYVAARVVVSQGRKTLDGYRADYSDRAKEFTEPLRDIEIYGRGAAWGRRPQYTVGFLAADQLVVQSGLVAFLGIWKAMGEGMSFERVFEARFGETLGRFYAGFEEMRDSR